MISRTKTLLYLLFEGQVSKRRNRLIDIQNMLTRSNQTMSAEMCHECEKLLIEIETLENIELLIYNTLCI